MTNEETEQLEFGYIQRRLVHWFFGTLESIRYPCIFSGPTPKKRKLGVER